MSRGYQLLNLCFLITGPEDIPFFAMPTIGQNVTVGHVTALHVPRKKTVSSEKCIN